MDSNNQDYLSSKWSGFKLIWRVVTIGLIVSLFFLWLMGYGPGGKACDDGKKTKQLSALSDVKAPVISLNDEATINLIAGGEYTEHGATAVDDVDGDLSVTSAGEVDTNTPGEYEITYSVTDSGGNTANEIRKVVVSPFVDTEVPEIFLVGSETMNIKVDSLYVDDGAIATDIPDGEIEVVTEGKVNSSTPGEYLVKYSATDKAGNTSVKIRTVTVSEPDNDAPIITVKGEKEIQLTIGDSYRDSGASAVDISDGKLDITVTGEVDTTTAGEYLIKYDVTDIAGNKAEAVRKVIVSEPDSLPPVITLKGDGIINLIEGDVYEELGASAEDSIDGEVDVLISGKVRTDVAGDYTLIYSAKDQSGNLVEEKRLVIVEVIDTDAPVITLEGKPQFSLNIGEKYHEPGVTAEDATDGKVDVTISGKVLTDTAGKYDLVYTAKDKAGNTTEATRNVIVTAIDVDKEAPSITLKGDSTIELKVGEKYKEAGASAIDIVDGEVAVSISGKVDTSSAGQYELIYSAADKAGNTAEEKRTITVESVVVDDVDPIITLNGESSISLEHAAAYEEAGAKAIDAEDGKLDVTISGNVDVQQAGMYELKYSASDKAGNTAIEIRKVLVDEPAVVNPDASKVIKAKLYFEFNKSNNPMSRDSSFAKVINYMEKNTSANANIYGFYGPDGDQKYNINLANDRAKTVLNILRGAGVQSSRLIIKKPIVTSGAGPKSDGRRVEVDIKD